MNQILIESLKRKALFVFLFSFSLFFFSAVCHADVCSDNSYTGTNLAKCELEKNFSTNVATSDVPTWYDFSNNASPANTPFGRKLNTFMICNFVNYDCAVHGCTKAQSQAHTCAGGPSGYCDYHFFPYSSASSPCNTVATDKSYHFSDDLEDETHINAPGKNFKITVSDPSASQIKIEWVNRPSIDTPDSDAKWSNVASHGSHTCAGSSCDMCIEGGSCNYPGIPSTALSVNADGSQNVFWYRVTVTDSSGNSVTTGSHNNPNIKPYLDSFYKFVICGPKCNGSTDTLTVVNGSASCSGVSHKFDWTVKDPSGTTKTQSEFDLQIQETSGNNPNTNTIHEHDGITSSTSFTVTSGSLTNGDLDSSKSYQWRIKAKDVFSPVANEMWSTWSSWQNLGACALPPSCSVSGVTASPSPANFGTNITFSGTISGTGITGYTWKDGGTTLGNPSYPLGNTGGTASNAYSFVSGGSNVTKTITLIGTLSNGGTCQGTTTVNLTVPPSCSIGSITIDNSNPVLGTTSVNFNASVSGASLNGYKWKWLVAGQTLASGTFNNDAGGNVSGNNYKFNVPPFSAGATSLVLNVTNPPGAVTLCTNNKPITLVAPPSCAVSGVTASPSPANFGTNITFSGNISGTGITGYTWKDGGTTLGTPGSLGSTGGTATNISSFAGATNITKTITLIGTLSNGGTCQGTTTVNLVSCTSNFSINCPSAPNCYYGNDATAAVGSPLENDSGDQNIEFQFISSTYASSPISGYSWSVDGSPFGSSSTLVAKTFYWPPEGNKTIGLTVTHANGIKCSGSQALVLQKEAAVPPPSCTADFSVPASGYYDQNISFDPSASSNTGEPNIMYTWSKTDGTLLGISNSVAPFDYAFDSSNISPVGVKLNVQHNTTGANCTSPIHSVILSIQPSSCSSTPALTVPASGTYGSNVSFSATASGTGIAKYEWQSSSVGTIASGNFSGGTISGNETLPSSGAGETITFIARDSSNNVIPSCTTGRTINLSAGAGGSCTTSFSMNPSSSWRYGDVIIFTAIASGGSGGYHYQWKVDDNTTWEIGGVSHNGLDQPAESASFSSGNSHLISLVVTDSNGNTCVPTPYEVVVGFNPKWNEIPPQLSSVVLILLIFIARIIFVRL
jgi:hypothetical protein